MPRVPIESYDLFMGKKLPTAIAVTLTFLLLSVSIVYACSGIAPMSSSFQQEPMHGGVTDKGPCTDQKQDMCRSVRNRMLSVQASPSQGADSLQSSTLSLWLFVEIPRQVVFSPELQVWKAVFHPVFKLSLPFSFLVLRI